MRYLIVLAIIGIVLGTITLISAWKEGKRKKDGQTKV
jgi:hypothetical protein